MHVCIRACPGHTHVMHARTHVRSIVLFCTQVLLAMKLSASETSFFPWLSERFHIPHSITSGLGVWIEDRVHVPPEKTLIRKQNLPLTYTRRWSVGLVYAWGFSYNDTIPDKHTFFFPSDFSYWLDWLWLDWLASHTAQLTYTYVGISRHLVWFGLVGLAFCLLACPGRENSSYPCMIWDSWGICLRKCFHFPYI